jgi:O-acetylhomoserine/O-acetylserine sulfhydrylase-like pyridoxal-dependent enzyme
MERHSSSALKVARYLEKHPPQKKPQNKTKQTNKQNQTKTKIIMEE